jgi:hypothetical protein
MASRDRSPTEVPVFVAFGQLVMFYWQLRLLNRWTNGTLRSCSGRRYERTRGVASRMGGEGAAGANVGTPHQIVLVDRLSPKCVV